MVEIRRELYFDGEMTMDNKRWCEVCKNQLRCRYVNPYRGKYCPGLEDKIDNITNLKEPLASDLIHENFEDIASINQDYKDVLEEMRTSRLKEHAKRHGQIMEMPDEQAGDLKKKTVAALLFFNVSPEKIARVLRLNVATVYRICRRT